MELVFRFLSSPSGLGTKEWVVILKDFFDILCQRGGRAANNPQAYCSREQLLQQRADDIRRIQMMVNDDQNFQYENRAGCDDDQMFTEHYSDVLDRLMAWEGLAE